MKIKKPVSPDREEVRGQLRRICCSKNFKSSPRLTGLLEFLVEEVLSGNGDSLGEYRVGIEALGLPQDFDPGAKSLVRSHAGRLRKALAAYYSGAGRDDLILISMPDVGYCVAFSRLGVGPRRSASPAKLPLLMLAEFRGIGLKAGLRDLPATVAEELSIRLARAAHLRVSRAGSGIAGLDPDFLLEGSIEHRGGKVLIRSRLMEGTTGLQIWARRHEFPDADWDLGTMEEKIIDAIAVETTSDYGCIDRHLLRQGAKAKTQAASLQAAILKFKAFETDYSEKSFRAAFHCGISPPSTPGLRSSFHSGSQHRRVFQSGFLPPAPRVTRKNFSTSDFQCVGFSSPPRAISFHCSHGTPLPCRHPSPQPHPTRAPAECRGYNAASAGNTIRNSAPPRGERPISSWPLWFSMVVWTI
jgi:TolB-like protein